MYDLQGLFKHVNYFLVTREMFMLARIVEAEEKEPPIFAGTDTSFSVPDYRICQWATHTLQVPFDSTLPWEDAVNQAGPDGIANIDVWPRDQIYSAASYFPPSSHPGKVLLEVVYVYMHAHRMTGVAWEGKRWMFPGAVQGWAETNNLRPATPRECLASGAHAAEQYELLSSHSPDGIRIASLFVHNLGVHPKSRWITHKENDWQKQSGDCFFSVALSKEKGKLHRAPCLDHLGHGDYFGCGYWFTYVRKRR